MELSEYAIDAKTGWLMRWHPKYIKYVYVRTTEDSTQTGLEGEQLSDDQVSGISQM